jgi:hypothetical protein
MKSVGKNFIMRYEEKIQLLYILSWDIYNFLYISKAHKNIECNANRFHSFEFFLLFIIQILSANNEIHEIKLIHKVIDKTNQYFENYLL